MADRDPWAVVRGRLHDFASTYAHLPLYRRLCLAAADDPDVLGLLLAARPGQARPVLLLAALHDLVLRRGDLPAARWYPSVTGRPVPEGDPWPDVRAAALDHADELRAVIATRTTQTNEVNRLTHVAPLLAQAAADRPAAPLALVELGSSAGLLLAPDRCRVELAGPPGDGRVPRVLGDPASPVRCRADVRPEGRGTGRLAGLRVPAVAARAGLDRHPVDLADADAVRWLEACLWPEQPERLERFRAAVDLLRADPPLVAEGDMVDDLGPVARSTRALAAAGTGADPAEVHLVVVTSWALTYVPRPRRPEVAATLAGLAADGRAVTWLTAEPPGGVPEVPPAPGEDEATGFGEVTVLGARRWRDGAELAPEVWGTSHPHGDWLRWEA